MEILSYILANTISCSPRTYNGYIQQDQRPSCLLCFIKKHLYFNTANAAGKISLVRPILPQTSPERSFVTRILPIGNQDHIISSHLAPCDQLDLRCSYPSEQLGKIMKLEKAEYSSWRPHKIK